MKRLVVIAVCCALAGCGVKTGPRPGLPVGVETAETAFDSTPRDKRYLLIVDSVTIAGPNEKIGYCDRYRGPEGMMRHALVAALIRHPAVSLADAADGSSGRQISQVYRPEKNESGPYVVRVQLSEFTVGSEVTERGVGNWRPSRDESVASTLGNFAMSLPGFWVTALTGLPTSWKDALEKSAVGLDVSIVNPRSQEVLTSFRATGTFNARSREIGTSTMGFSQSEQAASTVESAIRAALSDATKRIVEELDRRKL